MKTCPGLVLLGLIAASAVPPAAHAEPTEILVRVLSRDAKFIGTGMGGVHVTVTDVQTGEILAQGLTQGDTGDTGVIMKQERRRGARLSSSGAAGFTARLDLREPRRIEVAATGPADHPRAANRVTATQWIIPGRHLTGGDGWVLEMPGFVVSVTTPVTPLRVFGVPRTVELRATVTMMCGCPTEPGGLWDAGRYEIRADVRRGDSFITGVPLAYTGTSSQYGAGLQFDEPGDYDVLVYAHDPDTGNTGLDRIRISVER